MGEGGGTNCTNSMMRPRTIYSDLFSDDELEEIEIDKAEQAMDKERDES